MFVSQTSMAMGEWITCTSLLSLVSQQLANHSCHRTLDAYTGDVRVWINRGITHMLTSGISWDAQPNIWMPGVERGANIHFPRLSMSGRADYHVVYPQTGVADTWFNQGDCADGGAMDDGPVEDPKLPQVPE
jgi:hypothetical protein